MKKKIRKFSASFAVRAWVEVEISASNYDEALVKARELTVNDLIEVNGGHNDSYVDLVNVTDMTALDSVGG